MANTGLAKYDAMRQALQLAASVDEVKEIRDKTLALKAYAAQRNDSEARRWFEEIQTRAERRAGQLLAETERDKGGNPLFTTRSAKRQVASLGQLGLTRDQSSRWQKLAAIPEAQFESDLTQSLEEIGSVSSNLILRAEKRRLGEDYNKDRARKQARLTESLHTGVRKGDFREVLMDIPDASIPLILTDPPYPKEFLPLWSDLGKFAAQKLAPGGILASYSGQMFLPQVLSLLSEHLDYWWCGAVMHLGNGNLTPLGFPVRKVINGWKPILLFVRKDDGYDSVFRDVMPGAGPEKDAHNWAQPVAEAAWLIEMLSNEGDLIIDPFAGSGTVGVACDTTKRRFIGAEIL